MTAHTQALMQVPIDSIMPSRYQARKSFDEEALKGLAESMRLEGLIEPVVVRKISGDPATQPIYELIAGERRLRAAKILNWKSILVRVITTVSEGEAAAKGLVENLQREDLNPIEEAEAFDSLNKVDMAYWTQERIAQVVGKNQTYISRSLQLLTLPESIKDDMRHRIYSRNHGIELARLPGEKMQRQIADQIRDKLTVIETRRIVDSILIRGRSYAHHPPVRHTDLHPKGIPTLSENEPDPLEGVWKDLLSDATNGLPGTWTVDYRNGGWNIWLKNLAPDAAAAKSQVTSWFKEIGQKLSRRLKPHAPDPAKPDSVLSPQVTTRLPESPEEEAMLEALAKQGPAKVYAWIFGANSAITKSMKHTTWAQLGARDPVAACRELIAELRMAQGLSRNTISPS